MVLEKAKISLNDCLACRYCFMHHNSLSSSFFHIHSLSVNVSCFSYTHTRTRTHTHTHSYTHLQWVCDVG